MANSNFFVKNGLTVANTNTFSVNSTAVYVNTAFSISGGVGTAGQVLTSNGSSAPFWSNAFSLPSTFTGSATFANTVTFNSNATFQGNTSFTGNLSFNVSTVAFTNVSLSSVYANGALGSAGYILHSNSIGGVYWAPDSTSGLTITNYSSSSNSSTFYIGFSPNTSGDAYSSWANSFVSSKLAFVPSTGSLSATIFNTTSDANQKENIQTIDFPLEKLSAIRGVSFNWKDNGEPSLGVIAQEIEKIFPELVSTQENGGKVVNYNGIIALLIEAVKDLNDEIISLKGEK